MQKDPQQLSNRSSQPPSQQTPFKRKGNQPTSSQKISKVSRPPNRSTQRSFDQASISSANKSNIGATEQQNQKMMVLSNEARQALKSMQRFDRFIYVTESEKKLKGPIEQELKRLEKIKNSGNKLMKNTFYDNQLTITCLFNHMKNLYQLSRELGQIVTLKAENQVLQQKIIQMNMKFNKDLKQASMSAKGKAAEDQQTLKDTLKYIDTMIYALKEKNVEKGRKKIEVELKRATENRKELMELVHGILGKVGGGIVSEKIETVEENGVDIYQFNLNNLIQDQGSVQKNLLHLTSQKTLFQKSISTTKSPQLKTIYTDLKLTSVHLFSLNTTIKQTQSSLLSLQKKSISTTISQQDKHKLKQFQELQSRINQFQQDGEVWHKEMEVINIKVESEENVVGEVGKNRKLLNGKNKINQTVLKLVNSYFNLLELYNKSSSNVGSNTNSLKQISDKYNQLLVVNENLEGELKKLKKQLEAVGGNAKQQAEISKFINLLQQSLTLKEGTDVIPLAEYQKLKKYIDLNRKKIPEDFLPTFTSIQTLIKTIIQTQQFLKQKQIEDQKQQQLRVKQITSYQTIIKSIEKLLFSGDTINEGFMSKLRKGVEMNTGKIEKMGESSLGNLVNIENSYIVKLVEILGDVVKSAKGKGEVAENSKELEELKNSLKQKQGDIIRSNKLISQLEGKITKLTTQISQFSTKDTTIKVQLTQHKKTITTLQRDKSALQKTISSLQKDKLTLTKKLQQSQLKSNQLKDSLTEFKQSSKVSQSEDTKRMNQINGYKVKINEYETEKEEMVNQIDGLNQEIEELNRKLAQTTEELSVKMIQFGGKESELIKTIKQIQGLNNNNLHLTDKNKQLSTQKKQLLKQLQDLQRENQQLLKRIQQPHQPIQHPQLLTYTQQNSKLIKQLQQLTDRYNSIITEYENVQNQLQFKSMRLGEIELELNQKMRNLNENVNAYERLWGQNSRLQGEYGVLQEKCQREMGRVRELERDINNKVSNQNEFSTLKLRTQQYQSKLNQSQLQTSDLHLKINNYIAQNSQLQSQIRLLQIQFRDRTKHIPTTTTVISSGQFESLRYQSLKEENVMLKEQIMARDMRSEEIERESGGGGVSSLSQVSGSGVGDQETIKRLERELQESRSINLINNRNTGNETRLVNEISQLKEIIRVRDISLYNAQGDNQHLNRQITKFKQIQQELESKIIQLNISASTKPTPPYPSILNNNQLGQLKKDNSTLIQQNNRLSTKIRSLEGQVYDLKISISSKQSQIEISKHKIKSLQQSQKSQKSMREELMFSLNSKNSQQPIITNTVMQRKFLELESSIKAITQARNNDETISLKHEILQLKQKLLSLQTDSRVRYQVDSGDDRITELLSQKLHYVKTIKSMQTIIRAKDAKLVEIYDQREGDLRGFISENKKLQVEINRINERLVQEKVKHLISPQFLEDSLGRMENELVNLKKENVILKEQIIVLEQQLEDREKNNFQDSKLTDPISQKLKLFQSQKSQLLQRISLLSIYHRIQNQSQALVSNVNRLIDGILTFLCQSDDFSDCDFTNNEFLPSINQALLNEDYEHYFEIVEDLFKDLFFRVVGRKNEILEKQAQQLLLLREKMEELLEQEEGWEDDSYSRSAYGGGGKRGYGEGDSMKKKASLIALQHLFKLYLKAKDPGVLREISELLSMSQRSRYYE